VRSINGAVDLRESSDRELPLATAFQHTVHASCPLSFRANRLLRSVSSFLATSHQGLHLSPPLRQIHKVYQATDVLTRRQSKRRVDVEVSESYRRIASVSPTEHPREASTGAGKAEAKHRPATSEVAPRRGIIFRGQVIAGRAGKPLQQSDENPASPPFKQFSRTVIRTSVFHARAYQDFSAPCPHSKTYEFGTGKSSGINNLLQLVGSRVPSRRERVASLRAGAWSGEARKFLQNKPRFGESI
jgi:hypothetical protein